MKRLRLEVEKLDAASLAARQVTQVYVRRLPTKSAASRGRAAGSLPVIAAGEHALHIRAVGREN